MYLCYVDIPRETSEANFNKRQVTSFIYLATVTNSTYKELFAIIAANSLRPK
jgi:hypothetical protein